jgi:cell division protein DivIC
VAQQRANNNTNNINGSSFLGFEWSKVPVLLRNRYFIISFIFLVWVLFFDRSNAITQWKLERTLEELEEKKSYYEREIGQVRREKKELFSDDGSLEKFAREKYYMKKSNEDVFVIVEEE